MAARTAEEIRQAVSEAYGARAREVAAGQDSSCCGPAAPKASDLKQRLYSEADASGLPETVVSYGCGNPTAIAGLAAGETVLDLGSGAGLDCFLSARQVGPEGRVIGLDMTDDMLALAEQNKAKLGLANVEFRKGVMEAMPVEDQSIDVIISNCVINLSPDKNAVFREAFRVLRPGGRVHVSDVVLLHELSAQEQEDLNLWAGCISGALLRDDYIARLAAAGFADIEVQLAEDGKQTPWRSALINARRPGGADSGKAWNTAGRGETIELLAPAGLATGACCGTDATSSCC